MREPGKAQEQFLPARSVRKILRCAFESKPLIAGFERRNRVHLSANLENEFVPPVDFSSCVRQREAIFANPLDVHAESLAPDDLKVDGQVNAAQNGTAASSVTGTEQVGKFRGERFELIEPRLRHLQLFFFPNEPFATLLRYTRAEIPTHKIR